MRAMISVVVAAVFEAQMSAEQAQQLARLMEEGRATRPAGVLTASLLYEGMVGTLIAYWKDRETLDAYLATADVPRGTELMRKVGVEPEMRVVDVLELG
jgi:quinol monooxygenase YgiN